MESTHSSCFLSFVKSLIAYANQEEGIWLPWKHKMKRLHLLHPTMGLVMDIHSGLMALGHSQVNIIVDLHLLFDFRIVLFQFWQFQLFSPLVSGLLKITCQLPEKSTVRSRDVKLEVPCTQCVCSGASRKVSHQWGKYATWRGLQVAYHLIITSASGSCLYKLTILHTSSIETKQHKCNTIQYHTIKYSFMRS